MMQKNLGIIAMTMGDPGGIGPEIIAKALKKEKPSSSCAFLLIGSCGVFQKLRERTRLPIKVKDIQDPQTELLRGGLTYFLDISKNSSEGNRFQIGKVARTNGVLAWAAIEKAAHLAACGVIDAVATAPVNKTSMRLVNPAFVGHTEFFAEKAKVKNFAMMFISPRLNVTLATIHVPLKKVSALLTRQGIVEKIALTHSMLRRGFSMKKPRLAVCALNPHGKESGPEEGAIIRPAVLEAQKKGIDVEGPFSADQLFYAAYHGCYDALISMYHDQALGAFKMIALHEGVNVTLGLPYVRTSPDHGTAFDIAYQGKANPSSMIAALRFAKNAVLSRHARAG